MKKLYVLSGLFLLLTTFASSWGRYNQRFASPTTLNSSQKMSISSITPDVLERAVLGGSYSYLVSSDRKTVAKHLSLKEVEWIIAVKKANFRALIANRLQGITNFCGLNEKILASLFDKEKNVNLFRYHPNRVEVAQFFLDALIQPIVRSAAIYHLRGRSEGNDFLKNQQVKEAFCQIAKKALFWGVCSELRKIKAFSSVTPWFIPGSNLPSKDGRLKFSLQLIVQIGLSRAGLI